LLPSTSPLWKALLPAAREAICLEHVSGSRLYVGIFRATYGSSARDHTADMAFTDLELFEAFRAGVPTRLYLLADSTPDPRLTELLTLVETVLPDALVRVTSEADLRDRVERDIDIHFGRRVPLVVPPQGSTATRVRLSSTASVTMTGMRGFASCSTAIRRPSFPSMRLSSARSSTRFGSCDPTRRA